MLKFTVEIDSKELTEKRSKENHPFLQARHQADRYIYRGRM